jgi:plasmid stabilization system protein ParE
MARLPRVGPKELVLSQAARADLVDIARYTAESADEATAGRLAAKLDAELHKLARIGHGGVPREKLCPGLRLHIVGSYNIYFRVTATETRIVRVLNAAREVELIQFEPRD